MSVGENGTLVGKNPPLQSKSTITILYRTIDNKIRRVTHCFSNLHSTLCFVIKKTSGKIRHAILTSNQGLIDL